MTVQRDGLAVFEVTDAVTDHEQLSNRLGIDGDGRAYHMGTTLHGQNTTLFQDLTTEQITNIRTVGVDLNTTTIEQLNQIAGQLNDEVLGRIDVITERLTDSRLTTLDILATVPTTNSDYVIRRNNTTSQPQYADLPTYPSGADVNRAIYTVPGTYTWVAPANVRTVFITGSGAGAGGAGPCAYSGGVLLAETKAGTGGHSGRGLPLTPFAVTPGTTYRIVIGTGGTGGVFSSTNSTNPGTAGGATTFGTTTTAMVTLAGGKIGISGTGGRVAWSGDQEFASTQISAPDTGSIPAPITSIVITPMAPGGKGISPAYSSLTNFGISIGGDGGSSLFAAGGPGGGSIPSPFYAGYQGYLGSGGGGGASSINTTSAAAGSNGAGGKGGDGCLMLYWIVVS